MSTLRLMAIDAICQRGSVRDSDVATLRRTFTHEPVIGASDIDAVFRAHNLSRVRDPSWADFFIEMLTDYVVRELEPEGYVTAAHAGWLIARISNAGRVRSKTEHDLLLNVIDKARWVPESLLAFALAQIRDAVVTGDGPLRAGMGAGAGTINLAEIEQIRALLFAYGNEGPRAITQTEAELLIDIEQALCAQGSASPAEQTGSPIDHWPAEAWRDLFTKATVNAALAASGYAGPTREEALNEAALLLPGCGSGSLCASQLKVPRRVGASDHDCGLVGAYRKLQSEERALQRLELQRVEIITGEPVASADAGRLALRLAAPGMRRSEIVGVLARIGASGLVLAAPLGAGNPASAVAAA